MNKKVISLPYGALPHTKALVFGGASLKHQTRQEFLPQISTVVEIEAPIEPLQESNYADFILSS